MNTSINWDIIGIECKSTMRCVNQGKTLLQKRTDIWECKHQNKREVNWFAEFCEMELVNDWVGERLGCLFWKWKWTYNLGDAKYSILELHYYYCQRVRCIIFVYDVFDDGISYYFCCCGCLFSISLKWLETLRLEIKIRLTKLLLFNKLKTYFRDLHLKKA